MAAGGMVMGACLLVIALRMPWPVEFINFMLMGFGFYLLHGCIQVYVTELAPSARGSATAAHSMFFFLGQAAGPVVYGARPDQRRNHARARGRSGRIGRNRMDLRAASSAERPERLAAPTIGGDALVGHPDALRQLAGLPEHVDRHSATRIPVAADAQPFRLEQRESVSCRSRPCSLRGMRRDCGSC